ncbi:MAG: MFS transporter [Woeseiaceae bacterium]|nr:MFS transporter [Woeseiaceae bacterium]NIP21853.1 MFS transporter [Woeseiaceae bacterium]NIS90938.1 MFS transporter [Woeseiaceae bacterium]
MAGDEQGGPLTRLVRAATKVEPHEIRATVLSFVFVFVLMSAYFILRPVRDSLSSDWTDVQLSWLWTFTFFFSLIAVSIYGGVISRLRFKVIVPSVYVFFALTFVGFYLAGTLVGESDLVNRAYYVWLSVFSLFHLSVFWTFMSGLYNKEQAKRLYAVIALGATAGAIAGPMIPAFFADNIGNLNLLLIAAVLLLLPIPLIGALERLRVSDLGNVDVQADLSTRQRLGSNPLSGFTKFVSNPYLLAIGAFIVFYVIMNTFIYFELRTMLGEFERDVRTQYWAGIDLAVNSLAAVTALFVTGRIATRLGMPVTLALVPFLMIGGWLVVAVTPALGVLIGLQIARRAGNYAVTRPAREMLFTIVDAESRFKAKPIIDIVVYRGGDVATAWLYTGMTATLGLGLTGVAVVSAVICGAWAAAGTFLGRAYDDKEKTHGT